MAFQFENIKFLRQETNFLHVFEEGKNSGVESKRA